MRFEYAILACSVVAGLGGLHWMSAALAGAAVYVLLELATRSASPRPQPLADWQVGPWRSLAGSAFLGAGHCCLSWSVGAGVRLLTG